MAKDILEQINLKPTTLTEEREEYISRKTGVDTRIIKEILEAETDYASMCLKKVGKVNLLGRVTLIMKDKTNKKGEKGYHIWAKAPIRLYRKIDALKEIDLKEEKLNQVVQEITYLD